jgi:hypothetical protein
MRQSVDVELAGRKVKLFERSYLERVYFFETIKKESPKAEEVFFRLTLLLRGCLKYNFKWWTFLLKRRYTLKNITKIVNELTQSEMTYLFEKIEELEGDKKKVMEPGSPLEE